jgi:nicotinamidase-related amidase
LGSKLVAHAERMEALASDLERELSATDSRLEGSLRITARDALVQYVMLPKLAEHGQQLARVGARARCERHSRAEHSRQPEQPVFAPGSVGAKIIAVLTPSAAEHVVSKASGGAFTHTELQPLLHDTGIDTIIVAGLMTHLAVSLTAADGTLLGYHVLVAADATASRDLPAVTGARGISHEVVHEAALARSDPRARRAACSVVCRCRAMASLTRSGAAMQITNPRRTDHAEMQARSPPCVRAWRSQQLEYAHG